MSVEKDSDHVQMWKSGLEAGKNGTGGGDDEKKPSKTPRPAEERALVETTGMGWVEQAALRGAMALGIVLSRDQIYELGHEGDALDSAKFKQLIKIVVATVVHDLRAEERRERPQGVAQAGGERAGYTQLA